MCKKRNNYGGLASVVVSLFIQASSQTARVSPKARSPELYININRDCPYLSTVAQMSQS